MGRAFAGNERFARDRRLYVATYPTMLNLIQAGTTRESYVSPHFFDLVIGEDESHRSLYDVYKQVLDYFHAIKLGLTATPTEPHRTRYFPALQIARPTTRRSPTPTRRRSRTTRRTSATSRS